VDDKTIGFTLRPDLAWSDGFGAVSAEDVKFSFERIAGDKESPWQYDWDLLDQVEVTDARSGLIRLKKPYAPIWFTALPWYGGHIVCKKAVEAAGGKYTTKFPAQCGPYRLADWKPNVAVTLARNPDWKGAAPDFSTLRLMIIEDDKAAELAFDAREIDFTRVSIDSIPRYREAAPAGGTLLERPGTSYAWLSINTEHPKLKDLRVRQAIQYAIDLDAIMAGAYGGVAKQATGMVPEGMLGARDANLIGGRDVAKAKALLAEAGATDLTITISVLTDSTQQAVAQIIQANLAEAGITAEILPYDSGAFWNLGVEAEGDAWKDLQLTLMQFSGGTDPSENLVWFTPDQIGKWNWERWNNPEYATLYDKALTELDPAKRDTMYKRMQDLMEESGAYVFLTHGVLGALHTAEHRPFILPDGHLSLPRYARA
jgi:peptide/nickel transport system substrate-binding protein